MSQLVENKGRRPVLIAVEFRSSGWRRMPSDQCRVPDIFLPGEEGRVT
jgi:hypothetical protein